MSNSNVNYTVTQASDGTITLVIRPTDLGISASGKSHLFAKGTYKLDAQVVPGFDGATIALNVFGNKGKSAAPKKAAATVSAAEWNEFQAFKASRTGSPAIVTKQQNHK